VSSSKINVHNFSNTSILKFKLRLHEVSPSIYKGKGGQGAPIKEGKRVLKQLKTEAKKSMWEV